MPVAITYVSMRPEHPPLIRLYFDVTLENARAEPRWFLLPDSLSGGVVSAIDSVEVHHLDQQVIVGHFSSTYGFYALLLPGESKITLQKLPVRTTGKRPDLVTLDVVTASDLAVDGEPAQNWFGGEAMSDGNAVVSAQPLEGRQAIKTSRHSPDYRKLPITWVEDERIQLEVALTT